MIGEWIKGIQENPAIGVIAGIGAGALLVPALATTIMPAVVEALKKKERK